VSIHLIVLQHGFMGNPGHLGSIVRRLTAPFPECGDRVVVHNSPVNNLNLTMDGIDVCGHRLADDVTQKLDELRQGHPRPAIKLSFIGYSLGGLIVRYSLGLLEGAGALKDVTLKNFITFATPHLGARKVPGFVGSIYNFVLPRIASRTGEQLALVDCDHGHGAPLLLVMSMRDTPFLRALERFESHTLYANGLNDLTVSYSSASISYHNPYRHGHL